MPQLVDISSYLEDLPDVQKRKVMRLVESRGYDEKSYLTAFPLAKTPDGELILHVSLRPFDENSSYVAVSPAYSVSMEDAFGGGTYDEPPVMDRRDMLRLAR